MPDPVVIANRPCWARIVAAFWIAEVCVGLGFVAMGRDTAENGIAGVMIVGGVLLAAAGVVLAAIALRIALLKGTAIAMTGEGLIDRRIGDRLIPWAAITWKIIFNGRAYSLQFDVAPSVRKALDVYWEQRLMGRFNRVFKYPELTMAALGTGMAAPDLGALMARFKSPQN